MNSPPAAVTVPRAPEPPQGTPVPLFATVAPVIAALAIWAFTQSPFAMVFALLGPVVALATMADSRRRTRAHTRRERNRFERELVAAIHAIDVAQSRERELRERLAPRAESLTTSPVRDSERWRGDLEGAVMVRLGIGTIDSETQLQGGASVEEDGATSSALLALVERASELEGAPVTVDALLGIGVCGTRSQTRAIANAVLVQLAHMLSPADYEIVTSSERAGCFAWTVDLPHSARQPVEGTPRRNPQDKSWWNSIAFRARKTGGSVVVAIAAVEQNLPLECRVVVQVAGLSARVIKHPEGFRENEFYPEYVSERQALIFTQTLMIAAKNLSLPIEHTLAQCVTLGELSQVYDRGRDSLCATIGVGSRGNTVLDLVNDGPHAIVGGTTGSGKSELLTTWILALASAHEVTEVNFLLVDFKGGAAFSAVAGLPHTVGMLTDLDEAEAQRAILSLRAELSRRERVLAEAGSRSVDELDGTLQLARLVIVVDEFATLTNQLPELHDLFSDLASRGRSLGIHLILCTQRPAASIRDSVLANCSLRLTLRVTDLADSVAVVGTPDAVKLPRDQLGRAFVARAGSQPEVVQIALASREDVANITGRAEHGKVTPYRPWLDPLPNVLVPSKVPESAAPIIAFGLMDIPEEQRRAIASYDPTSQGNIMVLGGRHSGKTTALNVFAHRAANAILLPDTIEGAWDTVSHELDALQSNRSPTLLLVDNIDELIGKFPPDYEAVFVERLCRLAREGPRAGLAMVLTAGGIRGKLQPLASLCESTLLLRMSDKQEHVFAGGSPRDFVLDLHPGAGMWRGRRVQIVDDSTPVIAATSPTRVIELSRHRLLVVISSRPASISSQLERLGSVTMLGPTNSRNDQLFVAAEAAVILGDPDAWQAAWGVLADLRSKNPLAFHDCSLSDFRSFTRGRQLPPPVESASTLVVVEPNGHMFRAKLTP